MYQAHFNLVKKFSSWLLQLTPGGQIKSSFRDIEHPVAEVGQWSSSSSEDG
jgi:hypothetical protein